MTSGSIWREQCKRNLWSVKKKKKKEEEEEEEEEKEAGE